MKKPTQPTKKEYKEIFWALVNKQLEYFRDEKQVRVIFAEKGQATKKLLEINKQKELSLKLLIKIGKLAEIKNVNDILAEGIINNGAEFILLTAKLKKENS